MNEVLLGIADVLSFPEHASPSSLCAFFCVCVCFPFLPLTPPPSLFAVDSVLGELYRTDKTRYEARARAS